MQRFMILIQGGAPDRAVHKPETIEENLRQWHAWTQYLIEQGHYLAGDGLLNQGVRLSGSAEALTVTEGPFPESQELVGGFFVLQAKDMAEAIALCRQSPNYALGGRVEIRPFLEFVPQNHEAF